MVNGAAASFLWRCAPSVVEGPLSSPKSCDEYLLTGLSAGWLCITGKNRSPHVTNTATSEHSVIGQVRDVCKKWVSRCALQSIDYRTGPIRGQVFDVPTVPLLGSDELASTSREASSSTALDQPQENPHDFAKTDDVHGDPR